MTSASGGRSRKTSPIGTFDAYPQRAAPGALWLRTGTDDPVGAVGGTLFDATGPLLPALAWIALLATAATVLVRRTIRPAAG